MSPNGNGRHRKRHRKYIYVYLGGPIEAASDLGVEWRKELTPRLEALGFRVLDPCQLESKKTCMSVQKTNEALRRCKKERRFSEFVLIMTAIQDNDEALVLKSDIVIAFLPADTPTTGTVDEMWICRKNGGSVYIVTDTPLEKLSSWTLATCLRSGGEVFSDFTSLVNFLKEKYEHLRKK